MKCFNKLVSIEEGLRNSLSASGIKKLLALLCGRFAKPISGKEVEAYEQYETNQRLYLNKIRVLAQNNQELTIENEILRLHITSLEKQAAQKKIKQLTKREIPEKNCHEAQKTSLTAQQIAAENTQECLLIIEGFKQKQKIADKQNKDFQSEQARMQQAIDLLQQKLQNTEEGKELVQSALNQLNQYYQSLQRIKKIVIEQRIQELRLLRQRLNTMQEKAQRKTGPLNAICLDNKKYSLQEIQAYIYVLQNEIAHLNQALDLQTNIHYVDQALLTAREERSAIIIAEQEKIIAELKQQLIKKDQEIMQLSIYQHSPYVAST